MKEEDVIRELREVGCCSRCCSRFLGLRNPASYANVDALTAKYASNDPGASTVTVTTESAASSDYEGGKSNGGAAEPATQNGTSNGSGEDGPSSKRRKWEVCVCCLGVLQRETWGEAIEQVVDSLNKRGYESDTFACALSSPACIALREKSLQFHLETKIPDFTAQITPLKEAWKWSFGPALATAIDKTLDSGALCPLLITVNLDYDKDAEELETLRDMAPDYYRQRARNMHTLRGPETTRRCVTDVLASVTIDALRTSFAVPPPGVVGGARVMSVRCSHAPVYLAGRYIKLSRQLSQTPWLVDGERMMESSVQDLIFAPIAKFYGISSSETDSRLKLVAAGREDVDVRCLGTGRPFAVEVSDPHRTPTAQQLDRLAAEISDGGDVAVKELRIVSREDMALLKKGEEFKEKTYRALCIKLPDNLDKIEEATATSVTDKDLDLIRTYSQGDNSCRVKIQQKTPIRVLHRRPLLTRERRILHMDAERVPGNPNLFTLDLRTEAGTYVKEFIHGDLGRTRPCLRDVINANVDILALDVTEVHLDW